MRFRDFLLARLRRRREAGQWSCTGFGNNLDLEVDWDGQAVARMAEPDGLGRAELPAAPPASILTAGDLGGALTWCFRMGEGGEFPLGDPSLLPRILSGFRYRRSVGGTGARAACALARLGFPALVHLDVVSPSILAELEPFGLATVRGGSAARVVPVDRRLEPAAEEDAPHCIFQFREGEELELAGGRITCPRSNRLILTADRINQELPIDRCFLSFLAAEETRLSSLVLSGFNSVVEPSVMAARLDLLESFLPALRRKGAVVHLEDAAYHALPLKAAVLARLGPLVDVFGFNEQELKATAALDGQEVDVGAPREVLAAVDRLRERFGMPAVLLHTRDYALCRGRLPGRDVEWGMRAGHCVAAAMALHGRYGGLQEVEEAWRLPDSREGTAFGQRLRAAADDGEGGSRGRELRVVPAKSIPRACFSLGLGDAFAGGFQICS